MEKNILSKSTYIKSQQCLKALYLYKHRYFLRDKMPAERVAVFMRGTRVGIYAQNIFPGGIDCGIKSPRQYQKALAATQSHIENGTEIIYEAAFQADSTLVFLDILVKKEGQWHAYEVKSSTKLSDTYYKDAALQNYVIEKSGFPLASFNLIHINPDYQRGDTLEIDQLFNIVDVTTEVRQETVNIAKNIQSAIEILAEPHSPKIAPGKHCNLPYPCDFQGHCWGKLKNKEILQIPSLSWEEKWEILSQDKTTEKLSQSQANREWQAIKSGSMDLQKEQLPNLSGKNIALVRMLNFQPAIPIFQGQKPYDSTTYAIHIQILDPQFKDINKIEYIHRERNSAQSKLQDILENAALNNCQVFVLEEDTELHPKETHNLLNIIRNGAMVGHLIQEYNFNNIYHQIHGKKAWYKKYSIDKQAALQYEKWYRDEQMDFPIEIEHYLTDSAKYFKKIFLGLYA